MNLLRKVSREKEPGSSNDFLLSLIPYWPLFLVLIALSIAGGWLYLQMATPQYESHARILIKDEKKGVEEAKALEAFDMLSPKKSVDNELEVLKSKTLMNKVVAHLDLFAPIYEEGKFKDKLAYVSAPVRIVADSALGFRPTPDKVKINFASTGVTFNGKSYPLNQWVKTPYGNLKFIPNPRYAAYTGSNQGKKFYFYLVPQRKVVDNLASKLKVDAASKLSTIIDLSINDEVPERGEDILNNLIDAYNLSLVEQNNKLAANTIHFINDRLSTVQSELQAVEKKQEAFRANSGAIDLSAQGKLYLESVSTNDQKVGEMNMQLSVLNQIESYVKSRDMSKGLVPSTVGVNDPGLTQMIKTLYELQLEMESLKKTAGENNPLVLADKDKIEKIRPQILENILNQKRSLVASRGNLAATTGSYSSSLKTLPQTERALVDISREQSIKNGIYTFLLQKKEETALSFVSNNPGSQIIDRAESSEKPVSPKRNVVYLICVFLAGIIGLSVVISKESFGGKIMFQKDIEELTELPVIGEISKDRSKQQVVIGNRQRTLIAEQFRRLRTTLNYLGVGGQKKRILITSAISGEGKSFVSTNLAVSLALTGKKVVLLDFDLNKPTLSKKLNILEDKGISEYLNGEVTADEIIRKTGINDNLYFISSGALPDSPSELMLNGMAAELLNYLDQLFDYIIIDIAPVGPVSDAYIISPLSDATLYVVRHNYTPKTFVERIDENNRLNKLTNAAIVFNGVSQRGIGGKGYGYGYGYVYEDSNYHKRLSAG
ncbi:polysaccharide biosynthesis tyrosine autokinase [Mucilaginibacter sp. RS28]|uniref:non-specific protein-tyrosine kinase n=1 Tax=Mucilaginibacter straminoryzae TaxID=2932774 RepID=A0A9X2BE46_9SPHI|nr:polysaccharide biosynthesis tyrosine autokinase [Mucilaginibacter straminoryzae]MCJ8211023.1 polysaccharide biosynthesis tyrosine autokinase [Mucilaginibacter straminoryzae]